MNYQKIYENLITKAQTRIPIPTEYYESHHIIPRCLGGTDSKNNLVLLKPEEHYLAHLLLAKHHKTHSGLWLACKMMTVHDTNRRTKNKLYGFVRRNFSQTLKADIASGKKKMMSFKGRKHTDETKAQQAKSIRATLEADGWCKPVYQFDLQGNFIQKFNAIKDAAKTVKTNSSNILYTCEGKFNHCKGFIWEWQATTSRKVETPHSQKKRVRTDNGEFDSVTEVMKFYGFTGTTSVRFRCNSPKYPGWSWI